MNEGPVFELEIERVRTRYKARVRQSPVGQGGKSSFALPAEEISLEFPDLDPRHLGLRNISRQTGSAREAGQRLFEAVFTDSVLTAWQVARAQGDVLLRLRLGNDPRLLRIPWEILFDPERKAFVAIEKRVARSLDLPEHRSQGSPKRPIRALVVLSSPLELTPLETRREWELLVKTLGRKVKLTLVSPKLEEVDRALRSGVWHILHFVGHGCVDDEGGILFLEGRDGETRAVDHLRVGTFLSQPSLRLVVLNACDGASPSESDAFSGLAQALLKKGVPSVVAMQQPISDEAGIAFSGSFYRAIAAQDTVGTALQKARKDLFRDREAEWAIPVLYLNGPDVQIVRPSSLRILLIVALVSALLIGLLSLLVWPWPSEETQATSSLIPPRGAEMNPLECPSPIGLNMALVKIDPKPFDMGDEGTKESRPVHRVTISHSFCIGAYEVTQEQWARVMGTVPPEEDERYLPAHGIKSEAAEDFVRLLNERDPAHRSRLPTEAEWEYVARGKTRMAYTFLDESTDLVLHANCGERGDGFDGPTWVGQFPPNLWGTYDMLGNTFEWVSDWYGPYSDKEVRDPSEPAKKEKRIRRGGSWKSDVKACSTTGRSVVKPNRRSEENGFRIVREIR